MAYAFRKGFVMKMVVALVYLLGFGVLFANQTQETFLKACAQFDKGHVREALELYTSLDVQSPTLWYNIGCCYYILGQYAQALVAFRQAERTGTISLVKKTAIMVRKVQEKLELSPDTHWYRTALLAESYIALFLVQLLFLALLLGLIVCLWFKLIGRVKLIFLGLFLLIAGSFCVFDYWFSHQQYAVVLSDSAAVYAGPDKEFHKLGTVRRGQEVKVVQEAQSWYKVSFQELQGWIEQTDLC